MKLIFTILFSISLLNAFGQEYDKNWLIGQFKPYNGSKLTFEKDDKDVSALPFAIDIRMGGSTMSNKDGEIQFYTNGTVIASAIDHKVM
ncbi:MAG: hypothetical protein R2879_19765, partial [Saprospiraceae bacterium]